MPERRTPRLLGAILCRGTGEIAGEQVVIAPQPTLVAHQGRRHHGLFVAVLYLHGGAGTFELSVTMYSPNGVSTRLKRQPLVWPDGEIAYRLEVDLGFSLQFEEEGVQRLVFLCDGAPLAEMGLLVLFDAH